jgi:hypothetical protein
MHIKWNKRKRKHWPPLITATAVRSVRVKGKPTNEVIAYLGSYHEGWENKYGSREKLMKAIDSLEQLSSAEKHLLRAKVDERLPKVPREEAFRQWREKVEILTYDWVGPFEYEEG